MVCHLTYSTFNNILRVNRHSTVRSGISQSIRYETSILHTFQFIYQFQYRSRQVNAVRNHFYCHSIRQIYTFHRTFIFILTAFVETRHRIIEMRGMGKAYRIRSLNFIILGFGMCHGGHNPFRTGVLREIMRTVQFGTDVPTLDAGSMLQQRNIFILIRCFEETVILRTCHLRIQVRPFDVQTENRRIFLLHHTLANIDCLIKPFERSG